MNLYQGPAELYPRNVVESWADPNVPLDRLSIEDNRYIDRLEMRIINEGLQEPIIVVIRKDGSRMIWDGHHRLIALKRLGQSRVPVVFKEG